MKPTRHVSANPAYAAAMRELRRSSAASRHTDRHAERKKGHDARGGRAGARTNLKHLKEY